MEKRSNKDYEQLIDDSRRSFMKKGALASGALALGVSGSATVAAESSATQPSQALMFAYDYNPGRTLQMVARLQQSVTRQILGQSVDDGDAIVSDTSEWDTTLTQYQVDGDGGSGEYVLVFTRNGQVSDQLQLGTSATFFNDQFNLLEVTVDGG